MRYKLKTLVVLLLLSSLLFFRNANAEASESIDLLKLPILDVYEIILQTQYLHELCLLVSFKEIININLVYKKSGMSRFDLIIPKNYNRYVNMINTSEKKEVFLNLLTEEQKNSIHNLCEEELPKNLELIKNNIDALYEKLKKFIIILI